MAIGSLIIKEMLQLSDEDTVAMITENPYLQFFIGLSAFTNKEPFDASTMTLFRKRLSAEMMAQINQLIIDGGKHDPDDTDPGNGGSAEEIKEDIPSEPPATELYPSRSANCPGTAACIRPKLESQAAAIPEGHRGAVLPANNHV